MACENSRSKRTKRFLIVIYILAAISGAAITLCGIFIAQPHLEEYNFKETVCVVTNLQQDGNRTCSSINSGTSFTSEYPCSVVLVTYDVFSQNSGFLKVSSVLYYARNMVGAGCSFIPACFENPEINFGETESFLTFYGQLNTTYICNYNPQRLREVIILRQYSFTTAIMSLAIPGGVFALCALILLVPKLRDCDWEDCDLDSILDFEC